jgi:hypothetical protein
VPGLVDPRVFDLPAASVFQMPQLEYRARVLASIYAAAVEHVAALGGALVPYHLLPDAVWESLLPRFGIQHSEADLVRLQQAARRNAKQPSLPFTGDMEQKQQAASAELRALADHWVGPFYRQLEALYRQQSML